ncbi:DUF1134 domain-containing protein [Lichenifustis flavocetrariae]|uniref:DUF1134 domain-containing protein n=1 Tax=Lichenifustis flavocetrariae TaxID=2949735 RepID=A0AA41YT00_9HYPH|nr:DUF1134 domain-containing protein [Lichenifustis flavocetrariae]MCW6506765.1 DUF1134 domain-containing protein [Lichenifustis flavocetrariae]
MVEVSRRQLICGGGSAATALLLGILPTWAANERPRPFRMEELVDNGHRFFGSMSRGLAQVVQEAVRRWGLPNGYILGQEASGAFVGGVRYGEGVLYTRNAGDQHLYWQGPSIGFDAGADGDRTMMLVYNLAATQDIFRRFGGADGSAYLVGGFGFTALTDQNVILVPIRTGVGARFGVSISYLKFTQQSTWNPF